MTTSVGLRDLSHPGVGSGGMSSGRDRSNRRGQVKSRNVRPVGWEQNNNEASRLHHIVRRRRTLPISPTWRFCSAFRTLRVVP